MKMVIFHCYVMLCKRFPDANGHQWNPTKDKKLRLEDAINATKALQRHGMEAVIGRPKEMDK